MSFMMKPAIGLVASPGVVNKNESVVKNMITQNALPAAERRGSHGRDAIASAAAISKMPKKIETPCTLSGPYSHPQIGL